jgi:hypothetical protein
MSETSKSLENKGFYENAFKRSRKLAGGFCVHLITLGAILPSAGLLATARAIRVAAKASGSQLTVIARAYF